MVGLYNKSVRKFDNLNGVVKVAGQGVVVCVRLSG